MSNAGTIGRALYAKPRAMQFDAQSMSRLSERLVELDEHTHIRPITRVEELHLLPTGLTRDGFRYTAIGFIQLAHELSPGLSTLVPDVAGCMRKPTQEAENFDLGAAIGIFNSVLTLRFPQLRGHRLVCDMRKRRIEGMVGPKREYLKNSEMLQAVEDAIHNVRGVRFFGGELVGRRLTLWYRSDEPFVRLKFREHTHLLWNGYYFCNSESAGVGLRGTDIVVNRHGCGLGPFRAGTRLSHVGRAFRRRAERLFGNVVDRELPRDKFQRGLRQLVQTSLKISGAAEACEQQKSRLIHTLGRGRKIGKWVAQDVVENALAIGADDGPLSPMETLNPNPFAKRTAYDLFCALLRRSRSLNLERRESLEQAAYELMLGKIKLGD